MLSFHSLVIIHRFVLAFLVITWSFNCHEFVCHNTFRSEFKVINFQSIEYDQNVFIDSYHSISMRGCKRQLCRLLCITSSSEPCYLCQNTETCDDHRNWCSKSGHLALETVFGLHECVTIAKSSVIFNFFVSVISLFGNVNQSILFHIP
eukprot:939211_1